MDYEKILKELAPCGMDCARCVSYKDGEVVKLSKGLLQALKGYEKIAEISKSFVPEMAHYNEFITVLTHFAEGNCIGCRFITEGGCSIRQCHKKQQVDFCCQCPNYPCSPKTFNEHVTQVWQSNNDQMKEQGIEAFYTLQKQKPRY